MRTARFALVAAALAFAAPLASAQTRPLPTGRDDTARLRAAVEASGNRAAFSFNRGDIAGFIRAFADDIWVFPPNDQPFQGPDAALSFFRRSYDGGLRNLQLTTTGLDRVGPMAYETGIYTIEMTRAGQSPARDNGKYVHVWKRSQDGDWRIHFAMWSSNIAPQPTPR